METAERWMLVVGYESLYEVSDIGNVRRIGKAHKTGKGRGGGARIGRSLKGQITSYGYVHVQLWRHGKPKMKLVHCLVAECFIGPKPAGLDVNHIDGNKQNNVVPNLEYVTRSENNCHALRLGLRKPHRGPNKRTLGRSQNAVA